MAPVIRTPKTLLYCQPRTEIYYTFSCGAALRDLDLLSVLSEVCARDLWCYDPVKELYSSVIDSVI